MHRLILASAAALLASSALAQNQTVTTPEGAQLQVAQDLRYAPGALTEAQLRASTRDLFVQDSMNVFRRFARHKTADMVKFYTEALAVRSLQPIQLTANQQMILTGVGSGQIKLAAGEQGGQSYDLSGGVTGGTGIRFFTLTYPDADTVRSRFEAAGFALPVFVDQGDGTEAALATDPGGFPIEIVIRPGAKDNANDGVGVGIAVSNLEESRAFYREFVGLDELPPVEDALLGLTMYPYRHGETTLYLYEVGPGLPANTGSAGIQYVVSDAPFVDAKAAHRGIEVLNPLNRLRGFDLVTVWLYDPDHVTNYFAQVGPSSRTAQAREEASLTQLPPIPRDFQPMQTSWGEPDFRGGWPIDHLNGTPYERPEEQGNRVFLTEEEYRAKVDQLQTLRDRYEAEDEGGTMGQGHWTEMGDANRRTSFLTVPANGRVPAKTEVGQRNADAMRSSWRTGQSFRSWTDFDSWDRCITRGLPTSMFPGMYNNGIRIFQSPGMVAMQLEMIHEVRLIPTDGRDPIPAQIGNWMGESRGHWEGGNRLVIETTNFRPGPSATSIVTRGSPRFNDSPISTEARLVETLTMTDENSIVYEMLFTDPVNYTAPWGARTDWVRDDDYEQFEYACHEGNVQIRNYITADLAARERGEESE
ncbi:VOC family protein [Aurantiacibacter flavus]|uniref:VOC domain-containing protein n=1 Tax=Aurantiacibacter flavus TaxID=3145232 RepID=A0ABV0CZM3_9SPHN